MRQIDHFMVGGPAGPSGRSHKVWNPSTGEVQAEVALGDAALLKPDAPDVAVPPDLAALGRIQALYYVGQAPLMRDPQARPALEVYAVEFANGERLCGFHMAHGKVDGLRCV